MPPLTGTMEEMAERYFGQTPLTVDPATNTGMPVLYSPPADVGADRVVNAVAAYETYGRADRVPVIVVDFGTATTFDVISAAGEYIGGVICPGIGISADALFQRAARLPRVDVRKPPVDHRPDDGHVDAVGALLRLRVDGGRHRVAHALRTGGRRSRRRHCHRRHGGVISKETTTIETVVPDLTLQGLRIIWERHLLDRLQPPITGRFAC